MRRKRNSMGEDCAFDFLKFVGLNPIHHKELEETPRRMLDLYTDMTEGMKVDIRQFFKRPLPTTHSELVLMKHIEYVSLCEHHLWPFFGVIHVAYIPNERIVGLSKFVSAVRAITRRPQLQERISNELAETINEALKPKGVMVVVEGTHTCMMAPGRYDYPANTPMTHSAKTVTSSVRGVFLQFEAPRNEALKLIYGGDR